MLTLAKNIIKNKVVLYVSSRYLMYGIQFFNTMFIAIALGPFYIAVWGFINLVMQYISQLNFGVPYSLNVLLSVNKEDDSKSVSLLSSSLFLYLILAGLILTFFGSFHLLGIEIGAKYDFGKYVWLVVVIAILTHFNSLFTNYFRVRNRLWEIIFLQSVPPLAMLIAYFFATGEELIYLILWFMMIGQTLALLLYVIDSHFRPCAPSSDSIKPLLEKGIFLFVYNACFYLIMLSTRSVVSSVYEANDFGFFTFSFTLANTIMLLFDSFAFLIYPKTINRFNRSTKEETINILNVLRTNYMTPIHLVMYMFLLVFPFIIKFFPQYSTIFKAFGFMAMTVVFYSNCFGFSSYLTAKGKERPLSMLSAITLGLNILLALFIALVLKLSYEYVILATMLSYFIYNILLASNSYRLIDPSISTTNLLKTNFPLRLFLPFGLALALLFLDIEWYGFAGILILFVILNRKQIKGIIETIKRIIHDPSVINV